MPSPAPKSNKFPTFDPQYVQVSRYDFAKILGRSVSELDGLKNRDPRFPQPHHMKDSKRPTILYVLADCYAYSELLISDARQGKFP